ncbi:hypothetical protein GCK72_011395 [Caenorhabditis remanei]|uniref:DUF38 domain-containing protein n=1 Tax=Caenorhabditis remanei TaxID=31234 RepID=A0A6A5H7V4_CAERE|nr:hypothetical protein GCK72_011395 [Caenorhabditis remanei]KAF1763129.1 hypothetical protein GCK72_011395 [Caenorhabditis remanei]
MSLVSNQDVVVKEEKPEVTLAQILNVPDFVENYLDIDTRLRLRKTCFNIRKIINEKLLNIDCLTYKFEGRFTEISTNGDFKVSYEIIEGGLRVKYWDKEKVINTDDEEDQAEIIQRHFMSIFGHEKLRIDTLRIEDRSGSRSRIGKRTLRRTLNELFNKLKIRNLEYYTVVIDSFLVVLLRTIDPEHLKFLQIDMHTLLENKEMFYGDLYDLEEWKRLKSLNFDGMLKFSEIISDFTHFENAYLVIYGSQWYDRYNLSDLPLHTFVMELKDKLLQNPNLKQHQLKIRMHREDSDIEDIKASLQQYNTDNAPFPCWISIPYPDSDKKLEMLVDKEFISNNLIIWFKGPCYVKGEWEEDSSDEEDKDDSNDEEE